MSGHIQAGNLRHRVEVLTLRETTDGFGWESTGTRAAAVRKEGKRNLFSAIGLGAPTVSFTMRRCSLTLHQALRLHEKHCFLTDIAPLPENRLYMTVTAALIEPVACTVTRRERVRDPELLRPTLEQEKTIAFPACLTEKYVKFDAGIPNSVTEQCLVLVTPATVQLRTGELVEIDGKVWRVQVCHELDEFKHEYEIVREEDA